MKEIVKYLGSVIILIGVALLAFYYFGNMHSNTILGTAGVTMVIGLITHIVLNKRLS